MPYLRYPLFLSVRCYLCCNPMTDIASRLGLFNNLSPLFYKMLFFSPRKSKCHKAVVCRGKSKRSAFWKTKNFWNRLIILEDRSILVFESSIFTCSPVFTRMSRLRRSYPSHTTIMHVITGEHVKMIDSNTKIVLTSRIINWFWKFLIF